MNFRNIGALLVALMIVALPVVAQEQTGAIEGVVTDSTGAVVPGATVEARSASGARADHGDRHRGLLPLPGSFPRDLRRFRRT